MRSNKLKDFIREEFIGLNVLVYRCGIKSLEGIYGNIIDETKNTFVIETGNKRLIVPKAISKFLFFYNGYIIFVDGKLINKRPWERIKIKIVKKV
ncbi:MAG: hypothetical protein BXU00_02420 [Candidatus Nanoclepta minutus]|uniref:Ribonuclease P protein component 1 n=1 Tax=Candidatus Nanoclepta minutus TaxID=1940235 RepID=A0A397WMT4_9ARCH|nr:MAG: hypothetical protein BXU00_02420 [Candidatus Nanoclepta minutus]